MASFWPVCDDFGAYLQYTGAQHPELLGRRARQIQDPPLAAVRSAVVDAHVDDWATAFAADAQHRAERQTAMCRGEPEWAIQLTARGRVAREPVAVVAGFTLQSCKRRRTLKANRERLVVGRRVRRAN